MTDDFGPDDTPANSNAANSNAANGNAPPSLPTDQDAEDLPGRNPAENRAAERLAEALSGHLSVRVNSGVSVVAGPDETQESH